MNDFLSGISIPLNSSHSLLTASSDPRALHQEVQRLTSLAQSQASEIEEQRRKIQSLENFRDDQLRDLQKQFESIKGFNVVNKHQVSQCN